MNLRPIGVVRVVEGGGTIPGIYLHGDQLADYLAEHVCPESAAAVAKLLIRVAEESRDEAALGWMGKP